jgi:hypothetical protein
MHTTGNWKYDWHFEGVSVTINAADKIKQKAVEVKQSNK